MGTILTNQNKMNLLSIIREFTEWKIRARKRSELETARKSAELRAKETGRTHYVINVDGKPLVMNSNIIKVLKKKRMIDKQFFAPMEAIYTAKY